MSNDADADAQAYAGTAEGQGPVRLSEEVDRHLRNKREELFEEFEIRDQFPSEVLGEARERTENVQQEIRDEVDERRDLREMTTWTTDPADAQDFTTRSASRWTTTRTRSGCTSPTSATTSTPSRRCGTRR
jgi:ribonuclease R